MPLGADEAIAECGGRALLCGTGTAEAAASHPGSDVRVLETGPFTPGALAAALVPHIDDPIVVLPASADGRDLAPRLAHLLGRRLLAGAIHVTELGASLVRRGGLSIEEVATSAPFVATLVPGVRGFEPGAPTSQAVSLTAVTNTTSTPDVDVIEVLPADVATMDLAEAPRILGGGAGLDSPERFVELAALASHLGASMGATRVVTDRGWVPHSRQIGTTGAVVDPRLYLAFGISGAVQHTSGLGSPDHVVSINTDPHCPMMQMADLAIVSDANAVLAALAERLGADHA